MQLTGTDRKAWDKCAKDLAMIDTQYVRITGPLFARCRQSFESGGSIGRTCAALKKINKASHARHVSQRKVLLELDAYVRSQNPS